MKNILNFLKYNKTVKKPRTVAFVDYEHWYISLENMYHIKPDIKGWIKEMSDTMDVKGIWFFGDFSKGDLPAEITKIRAFTNNIIDTKAGTSRVQKDFTDFIMLDNIYQKVWENGDNIDNFVIFTGDGHFYSVVSFLKNVCKKEVVIYAVKGAFSNQLKATASRWVEYPNDIERMKPYFRMIFDSMDHIEKSSKPMKATFIKTVEQVSAYNNAPVDEVRTALQWLVDNGYIIRQTEQSFGKMLATISVDWHSVLADGLWLPEKQKEQPKNLILKKKTHYTVKKQSVKEQNK